MIKKHYLRKYAKSAGQRMICYAHFAQSVKTICNNLNFNGDIIMLKKFLLLLAASFILTSSICYADHSWEDVLSDAEYVAYGEYEKDLKINYNQHTQAPVINGTFKIFGIVLLFIFIYIIYKNKQKP